MVDFALSEYRTDRILCFVFRSEEDSILVLLKQALIAQFSCFSNVVKKFSDIPFKSIAG